MKKTILSRNMSIAFTKMNSQGNDFILIDLAKEKLKLSDNVINKIIQKSDNEFDQLLLIDFENNSETIFCQIFNCDGSKAFQCGNGLRAIMLYMNTNYSYTKIDVSIEKKKYSVYIDNINGITASMGVPRSFELIDKNVRYLDSFVKHNVLIDPIKQPIDFYLIELGNKHCIIIKKCTKDEKNIITSYFDKNYGNLLNIEFVDNPVDLFNLDSRHFIINVYEAGAGWTKSCGSGATAVASLFYAIHEDQLSDKLIYIQQDGGELKVNKINGSLLLTGPSTIEYEGVIDV